MAEPGTPAAPGSSPISEGAPVALKGRFDIDTSPLGDGLSSPHARGHAARDRLNEDHGVFALVCDPDVPPRLDVIERLKDYPSARIVRLVDAGVVAWPETGDHRFVLILERPPGLRLTTDFAVPFARPTEKEIIDRVIRPALDLLYDFRDLGITTARSAPPTSTSAGIRTHR